MAPRLGATDSGYVVTATDDVLAPDEDQFGEAARIKSRRESVAASTEPSSVALNALAIEATTLHFATAV